ncbi:major facilitator superfamily domain-containing protein [Aspergillus cavernicola]|uniref:Major facilitator superfamily domain-containing protein n=1 Tax=Aspergillus cavernicola TaxID=176166 RepID=A0ABR4HCY3_9EURO
MTTQPTREPVEEKPIPSAEHHDELDRKPLEMETAAMGQGLSGYETLGLWETVKAFKMTTFICFMVCFSAATDGYQIGINGNIIANPGFVKQFATQVNDAGEPALSASILSAWSAIMSVGQIIGMTSLAFITDRFGRKISMYWYWLILALSILLESLARKWQVWLVAKIFAGIGVGSLQSTIPAYVTEVAPTRIRGGLLMCYSFWFSIMIVIYVLVPESPAWCVNKGKYDQARKALRRLNYGVQDYDVEQHLQLYILATDHERTVAAEQRAEKWYAIFKGTDGLRTLVASWTLVAQQFIGLTLFSTYASYFFLQAGLDDPFQTTCITSSITLAGGITLVFIADRFGRRLLSCSGTTICWAANVVVGILGVTREVKATNYIFILFACIWNLGLVANGATGWGFIGEISSQRLRPYTAGFAAATSCVAGVIMNVITPYMVNESDWNWGLKTAWFYAGLGLPFTVIIWFLIPETAGRSAAELDELFERKIKPWRFHKTTTATQRTVEGRPECV